MTKERMIEIMELAIEILPKSGCNGLCSLSFNMWAYGLITRIEEAYFDSYIEKNGPPFVDYYEYRWIQGDHESRIQWLKQQIEILKNQSHAAPNTNA